MAIRVTKMSSPDIAAILLFFKNFLFVALLKFAFELLTKLTHLHLRNTDACFEAFTVRVIKYILVPMQRLIILEQIIPRDSLSLIFRN